MKKTNVLKTPTVISWIVILIVFITLMAIASVFDLQIAKAVADLKPSEYVSANIFGKIFETIGEMPIYIVTCFALIVIILNCQKIKNYKLKILAIGIFTVATFGLSLYGVDRFCHYVAIHTGSLIGYEKNSTLILIGCIAFSLVTNAFLYFAMKQLPKEFISKLLMISIIVVLTAMFSQIIIQSLKIFASRWRYRTINVAEFYGLGGESNFTNFFSFNSPTDVPQALIDVGVEDDGFKSFPSGHTGAISIMFVIMFLPNYFSKLNTFKWKVILTSIALACVVTVAYSRMVMGAHYLSDVVFSAFITLAICFLNKSLVNKFKKQ